MGKIVYPPCRTAVAPPSDWTPTLAERSARLPEGPRGGMGAGARPRLYRNSLLSFHGSSLCQQRQGRRRHPGGPS
eukprot:1992827-Pyramimonas_sp.AAC.1